MEVSLLKNTSKLIHILDKQSDRIIGTLNHKKAELWSPIRKDTLDNKDVFNFIANEDSEKAALLTKRNRLVIQDEDGFFREYRIFHSESYRKGQKSIRANASYTDLYKAKIIEPRTLEGATASSSAELALFGTGWKPGIIEYAGTKAIIIENFTNPLAFLKQIAAEFGLELRYRIEISGTHVVGRFVDLIKPITEFEGTEVEVGKNLIGLRRIESSLNIVTALMGIGPERNDGTRLTVIVEDKDALQRWGVNGQHLIEPYFPDTFDQDMTIEQLTTLTQEALKKRIDASVTYEADVVATDHILGKQHERTRVGKTIRIKDTGYQPPLYLEARIQEIERDHITNKAHRTLIGNFIEYSKEDLEKQVSSLRKQIDQRISKTYAAAVFEKKKIMSDIPPADTEAIWIYPDPTKQVNVAHAYDGAEWVPLTTTDAGDIVTGEMLFDRLQGGTLRLGEMFGDGDLKVFSDIDSDGVPDVVGSIDENGAYFPFLHGDVITGNVENVYTGGSRHYYFDMANGNDENGGGSWATAKKNVIVFIDSLPKNLNGQWIQLNVRGDILGGIHLHGFHNGDILFASDAGSSRPRVFGQSTFRNLNRGKFLIQGFDANGDNDTANLAMFEAVNCDYIQFYSVKVYGNNKAKHAFWFENSKFLLGECHGYQIADRGLYATRNSKGYLNNCHGDVAVGILVDEGSVVMGSGSRWNGPIVRWNGSITGTAASNGWTFDPWTIDYGEASAPPPPPAPSTEQTLRVTASAGDNWGDVYGWENNAVKQGNYNYGTRYGVWYFDLTAIKGKTIVSATITINRLKGGASDPRTVYFRSHRYKTRSARSAGQPALSAVGATTSIAVGDTKTVDVTAMVQANIASGIDESIGVHTTGSTNYMALGTAPTLTIRYK
jgi:phage minor structural protein